MLTKLDDVILHNEVYNLTLGRVETPEGPQFIVGFGLRLSAPYRTSPRDFITFSLDEARAHFNDVIERAREAYYAPLHRGKEES